VLDITEWLKGAGDLLLQVTVGLVVAEHALITFSDFSLASSHS
jgi:hypothetical protein